MIEKNYNISFVAEIAKREKQIQQNYRPIIAIHKWFARRPGTLFRALILSEFSKEPIENTFYKTNKLGGIRIADPFMGGGTPLVEANRVGCDIVGFDINPMAYWIVKQEIEHLEINDYRNSVIDLLSKLRDEIGQYYTTNCPFCSSKSVPVKYFLWVKQHSCSKCETVFDLFPGYLMAENVRHPKNVIVCHKCGELNEVDSIEQLGECHNCKVSLRIKGPTSRSHCKCPNCGFNNKFPNPQNGPPDHRLFAIEFHCPNCANTHKGRFFKKPDHDDLSKLNEIENEYTALSPSFIPSEEIPPGDETNRLLKWGYRHFSEMFNKRQLLGLELSCRLITQNSDSRIRNSLATNLSDLIRYQNMLCRYDTMALKSLDIFSVHGFPVGLIQCESNLFGIRNTSRNLLVGSGGWLNIFEKFTKAKQYCDAPFEVAYKGKQKKLIYQTGEWIGESNKKFPKEIREVSIKCSDASKEKIPHSSIDAVFTDPPYFGNVQYAELMDFCYIWLRKIAVDDSKVFTNPTTRNQNELTINVNMGRDSNHFTLGLSKTFQHVSRSLKPESPLIFTYHHNLIEAYLPVAVAVLDSNLICTATLPCPAEMGASIHIKGTESSIVDTIFICRSRILEKLEDVSDSPELIAAFVKSDIQKLKLGKYNPTKGDIRCMISGHLTRMAIWYLKEQWNPKDDINNRIELVRKWISGIGGVSEVERHLND